MEVCIHTCVCRLEVNPWVLFLGSHPPPIIFGDRISNWVLALADVARLAAREPQGSCGLLRAGLNNNQAFTWVRGLKAQLLMATALYSDTVSPAPHYCSLSGLSLAEVLSSLMDIIDTHKDALIFTAQAPKGHIGLCILRNWIGCSNDFRAEVLNPWATTPMGSQIRCPAYQVLAKL